MKKKLLLFIHKVLLEDELINLLCEDIDRTHKRNQILTDGIQTDIEGNSRQRPTSITITVTNVFGNAVTESDADLVAVYALTASGGDIKKDTMACDGGETVGNLTLDVDTIPTWVPAAGRLVLVDIDAAKERIQQLLYIRIAVPPQWELLDSPDVLNLKTKRIELLKRIKKYHEEHKDEIDMELPSNKRAVQQFDNLM